MEQKMYVINKGINRPIEFRGLRAQYIGHLGGSVVGVLVVFTIIYVCGVPSYLAVLLALGLGGILVRRVYRMNRIHGPDGLMKRQARKVMPAALRCKGRACFIKLYSDACATRGTAAHPGGGGGLRGE